MRKNGTSQIALTNLRQKSQVSAARLGNGTLMTIAGPVTPDSSYGPFSVPGANAFLAWARGSVHWMYPHVVPSVKQIPAQTQAILFRYDHGGYGFVLPLVDERTCCTFKGGPDGLTLVVEGLAPGEKPDSVRGVFTARGSNPYALISESMKTVADLVRTFRVREEKEQPAFLDALGWCTWDSYHENLSFDKTVAGLKSLKKAGIPVSFLILDDGWLDADGDYLNSFDACPVKFPGGLKRMVEVAKGTYGITTFGIWHTLEGYWCGLNPKGALAKRYDTLKNRASLRPTKNKDGINDVYLVAPGQIGDFFNEWYEFLYKTGVDMVKVDQQSALNSFGEGKVNRSETMRTYQQALQGAAGSRFPLEVIHCMSQGADVAFNMRVTSVWRNTHDHQPHTTDSNHQFHIYANGLNALWSSSFAIPDWDMFQSDNSEGAYHAASRAICGGPIYLSDEPGKHDLKLVRQLLTDGGKVLRCKEPALPCEDSIFSRPFDEPVLMKLFNRSGAGAVVGCFQCNKEGQPVAGRVGIADIPFYAGQSAEWAAYRYSTGEVRTVSAKQSIEIKLRTMEWELVWLVPVADGIAPLGLLDKMNGQSVFTQWKRLRNGEWVGHLIDGGKVGLYCSQKPSAVYVDGKKTVGRFDAKKKLLVLELPLGKELELLVVV